MKSPSPWLKGKRALNLFLHTGIDETTPVELVDKIIYLNACIVIGTLINFLGAQANFQKGYFVLLSLNLFYEIVMIAAWILGRRHHYLMARVGLLCGLYSGMLFISSVQGPVVDMEYFLLPFAVLAFNLFLPSERKWAWLFGLVSALGFLYLVQQTEPLLNIDPARGRYTVEDLRLNQFMYIALFTVFLMNLSNAYAKAVKLVDEQRTELFERSRLSSVGSMAANMAHEINSPLTALDLQLYNLENSLGDVLRLSEMNKASSSLEQIKKISHRISTIVRGFNMISSGEDEKETLISLEELVRPALELNEEKFKQLQIQLTVDSENSEQKVYCRPVAVSQVVLNLVNNAMDALAEKPKSDRRIRISFAVEEKYFRIHVQDSGRISSEIMEKLFQPFFTTKPRGRGTGLGLVISRKTMEQHAGSLEIDPKSENTNFVMRLPKPNSERPLS